MNQPGSDDLRWMRRALALARRGLGATSPNPMVGAVLTRDGRALGEGWHHQAGLPHAEIEALRDAARRGESVAGATLYVTLEPCCTHGRTPPCTDAIIAAGVRRVVAAAGDPNPLHAGRGCTLLRAAGIEVAEGVLAAESARLNRAFNRWIVRRRPWVTLKAAMTLDGKIATAAGESRWITGEASRRYAMQLRRAADAILVGVGTVAADDPRLTVRTPRGVRALPRRRIILDPRARTPMSSRVVTDEFADRTWVVVGTDAPDDRVKALEGRVRVLVAPGAGAIDLEWLADRLGAEAVTHLLVEGGGVTHAAFLRARLAQEAVFFYAPKILGGRHARRAVAGDGVLSLGAAPRLARARWRTCGPDLLAEADIEYPPHGAEAP